MKKNVIFNYFFNDEQKSMQLHLGITRVISCKRDVLHIKELKFLILVPKVWIAERYFSAFACRRRSLSFLHFRKNDPSENDKKNGAGQK